MDTSKKPVIIEHEENGFRHFWNSRDVWFNRPVKIALAIIILIALVIVGRTIHHHVKNENKKPVAVTPAKPAPSTPAKKQSSTSNSAAKTSSGTATNSSTPQSPSELTNTGPGDVAAIFGISALLAGGAHYSLKSRRQN